MSCSKDDELYLRVKLMKNIDEAGTIVAVKMEDEESRCVDSDMLITYNDILEEYRAALKAYAISDGATRELIWGYSQREDALYDSPSNVIMKYKNIPKAGEVWTDNDCGKNVLILPADDIRYVHFISKDMSTECYSYSVFMSEYRNTGVVWKNIGTVIKELGDLL